MIANVEQMIHDGSILHDEIGLRFSKVKWKYTQQKIGGGASGNTAGDLLLGVLPLDLGEDRRRCEWEHGGRLGPDCNKCASWEWP